MSDIHEQMKSQRDILAKALGDLLVHIGITRPIPLTGPELVMAAEDALGVDFIGIAASAWDEGANAAVRPVIKDARATLEAVIPFPENPYRAEVPK